VELKAFVLSITGVLASFGVGWILLAVAHHRPSWLL
jgi:hypothetical protein